MLFEVFGTIDISSIKPSLTSWVGKYGYPKKYLSQTPSSELVQYSLTNILFFWICLNQH